MSPRWSELGELVLEDLAGQPCDLLDRHVVGSWVSGTTSGPEPLTDGTPSKPLGIAGSANRAASTTCRAEERSGNPTFTPVCLASDASR